MLRIREMYRIILISVFSIITMAMPTDRPTDEMLRDAFILFIGKPIVGVTISPDPLSAAQCAQQCTKEMRQCAHNEIPGFEKQIWSFQYEPGKLERYCQIHENGTGCLRTCPESIAKSLAKNGLDIGKHICNESDIRTHAQCINEAVEPLQTICPSETKCGKYPLPEGQDIRPTSVDDLRQIMKQTCLRLKCNLECTSSSIQQRCGDSAEHDVESVVQAAVKYLKSLTDMIKIPRAFAAECGLLANMTITF